MYISVWGGPHGRSSVILGWKLVIVFAKAGSISDELRNVQISSLISLSLPRFHVLFWEFVSQILHFFRIWRVAGQMAPWDLTQTRSTLPKQIELPTFAGHSAGTVLSRRTNLHLSARCWLNHWFNVSLCFFWINQRVPGKAVWNTVSLEDPSTFYVHVRFLDITQAKVLAF